MSKKINYDNLYVAFHVYDYQVETEMYVHYETFGTIEHRIIVNPKKKLIYSQIDENGNEKFYEYKTNEEVFEESYESSFKTNSSPLHSLYFGFINGYIREPFQGFKDGVIAAHKKMQHTVGYLIPVDEYLEEKLGYDVSSLKPDKKNKLIRHFNNRSDKSFILSMDPEEAKLQLEKIGYRNKSKKKQI